MSKANIAIIGGGGIGRRHLQSCCDLPSAEYKLHVVDPSPQSLEDARRVAAEKSQSPDIAWLSDMAALPREIDFAVVATRSDIRAAVIRDLHATRSVKNLLLEKVLFQTLAEYGEVEKLLARAGTRTWVNCPTRIWPGYLKLRSRIDGQTVSAISVEGANWDLGCNAIHYLDLFAFLLGSADISVEDIDISSAVPAKRSGMLHIEGTVAGSIKRGEASTVPFRVVSSPTMGEERVVEIALAGGTIRSVEGIQSMNVFFPDDKTEAYPVPFQSQLTSGVAREILSSGACDLPDYAESRRIHEPMLTAFLDALSRRSLLSEPGRCPIT